MLSKLHPAETLLVLVWWGLPAFAQQPPQSAPAPRPTAQTAPPAQPAPMTAAPVARPTPPQSPAPAPRPAAQPTAAAVVNGQAIPEVAVQRALKGVPPAQQTQARAEILDMLIDDVLIDQHLSQLQVAVDSKEVEVKLQLIREDIQKRGQAYETALKELLLTEEELRSVVEAQLRWDKYAGTQAKDEEMKKLFDGDRELFDGTMVRARHILKVPDPKDPQGNERERVHVLALRKKIEDQVAQGLAQLPPSTDNLAREKKRMQLLEEAFSDCARVETADPASKESGGDLNWFPRSGSMLEPFSKTAFSLKPYQLSEPVRTPFGWHLILVTDRRSGHDVKFEEVKDVVEAVFYTHLRDSLSAKLKPAAKITITPPLQKP
jgi:peptidyl-prolyl cis-trans isomerase C